MYPQSSGSISALAIFGYTAYLVLTVYYWLVIVRVLLTWFTVSDRNPVVSFLSRITDPFLNLLRRIFPLTLGGIDFSPVLAIALIYSLANFTLLSCRHIAAGASPGVMIPIFILCLLSIIKSLVILLMILMLARIILSMVSPSFNNPLVLIIYGATEPLLSPLRGILPHKGPYGLDLKAVLFLAFLFLFNIFLMNTLLKTTLEWAGSYGLRAL